MKAVYALYPDGHSAQQALSRLQAAGVHDRDITIQSAQPMEDFEFGHREKATWMWWIACGGGLIGMASALGLTWLTEVSWPINVGGLPIFAWWPNLIITFELTMLGRDTGDGDHARGHGAAGSRLDDLRCGSVRRQDTRRRRRSFRVGCG